VHNRAASQDHGKEKVYVKMKINGTMTSCLVDTGSDATLIPASFTKVAEFSRFDRKFSQRMEQKFR